MLEAKAAALGLLEVLVLLLEAGGSDVDCGSEEEAEEEEEVVVVVEEEEEEEPSVPGRYAVGTPTVLKKARWTL
jgi:hypothetical protein